MKFCYVVPEKELFHQLFESRTGFVSTSSIVDPGILETTIESKGFYADREHMEVMPDYKQIIPCFMLYDIEKKCFLLYQRKAKHTETRLAQKWTPVFGGHVDPGEATPIVYSGLKREAMEETGIDIDTVNSQFRGYIYDDKDEVGRVHLGMFWYVFVSLTPELIEQICNKDEIEKVLLVDDHAIEDLLDNPNYDLEGWAKIVLKNRKFNIRIFESLRAELNKNE